MSEGLNDETSAAALNGESVDGTFLPDTRPTATPADPSSSKVAVPNRGKSRGTRILRRGGAVVLLGVPFLALGVGAAVLVPSATLERFDTTLLSSCLALALGAVSVSFVVFQLTPYRAVLAGASPRQLVAALVLAAVAVAPIGGLLIGRDAASRIAVGVIPSLILAGVLLVRLAQREGEPAILLARGASSRRVRRYCWSVKGMKARLRSESRLEAMRREREPRLPPPSHEIFRHVAPPVRPDDPFDFMSSIAAAAVERRDVATYTAVLDRAIEVQAIVREMPLGLSRDEDYRVRAGLIDRARSGLADVVRLGLGDAVSPTFAERCVDLCLDRVRAGAEANEQESEPTLEIWTLGVDAAAELLARGQPRALIEVLVAGHHAAEAGMVRIDERDKRYALAAYPRAMVALGERAVEVGDVESLYRVLEALGWIGCAAILRDDGDVGRAALQGLVRLGRLARRAKLECFWPRCLLAPVDHADERIQWVASWLPRVEQAARDEWMRILGTAWSRLRGHRVSLRFDGTESEPRIRLIEHVDQPHTESINDNGRARTIDYSDAEMAKDAHLY